MIEANRIKLGIFLTFGVAVLIAGIFFFGFIQFFQEKIPLYTIFTNSIDGLSIGSPVRYNGVTLGNVTEIKINKEGDIAVYMDIYFKALDRKTSSVVSDLIRKAKENKDDRNQLVDEGLRCSIQLMGISGDKYINFAFYDTKKFQTYHPDTVDADDSYYIPSVASYMPYAIDNLCRTLENISTVDFKQIADNVNKDLHALKTLAERLESMMNKVQMDELNNSLISTLNQIDEMSNNITILSQNINNNPSSVVWGSKDKPIFSDNDSPSE